MMVLAGMRLEPKAFFVSLGQSRKRAKVQKLQTTGIAGASEELSLSL